MGLEKQKKFIIYHLKKEILKKKFTKKNVQTSMFLVLYLPIFLLVS